MPSMRDLMNIMNVSAVPNLMEAKVDKDPALAVIKSIFPGAGTNVSVEDKFASYLKYMSLAASMNFDKKIREKISNAGFKYMEAGKGTTGVVDYGSNSKDVSIYTKTEGEREYTLEYTSSMLGNKGYVNLVLRWKDKGVNEAWVIKSRDGLEKRFKNADSPEAIAWQASIQKKPKGPVKYSFDWWMNKSDAGYDGPLPWTKIESHEINDSGLIKDHFDFKNVDYEIQSRWSKRVDDLECAGATVRVMYLITPEDDMGTDESFEDSQSIKVIRDAKEPSKIVFAGY